jgi:hypothetical protein
LANLLDQATVFWGINDRSKALRALLEEGGRSVEQQKIARRHKRCAALNRLAGSCVYPTDYLEQLRNEWPE